jgi:glycosyltransferase involved in cell wall biosynthesis
MLAGKTIAVVVPAFNEEKQIGMVIETMPDFVDRIIIINDCSKDKTEEIVKKYIADNKPTFLEIKPLESKIASNKYNRASLVVQELLNNEHTKFPPCVCINENPQSSRIILLNHMKNSGKGAAIATGYKWAKDHGIDCTATMDGDGQMDPDELESICLPVVLAEVDYVKGNRLIHRSALLVIPKVRFIGNSVLSLLTKIASGYWHVSDTQTGYTAISRKGLLSIRLFEIYPRYGYPNDILIKLNIAFCKLKEVEIKPVYDIGEESKMKILKVIPAISWLLLKGFFRRLWQKYLFRDFHPLFLLYNFAFVLGICWMPYCLKVGKAIINSSNLSFETLFAFTFLGISSVQSLLFAMWMDIQDNERLYKS